MNAHPPAIACAECAQQPGEWCATWNELAGGMLAVAGLVHPQRAADAQWVADVDAGRAGDAVHEATPADVAAVVDGELF